MLVCKKNEKGFAKGFMRFAWPWRYQLDLLRLKVGANMLQLFDVARFRALKRTFVLSTVQLCVSSLDHYQHWPINPHFTWLAMMNPCGKGTVPSLLMRPAAVSMCDYVVIHLCHVALPLSLVISLLLSLPTDNLPGYVTAVIGILFFLILCTLQH